jgi:hypothetical protein
MKRQPSDGLTACFGLVALLALSLPVKAAEVRAAEVRAVVELFTSQGCNSCPPADKLMGDLSKDPTIIPLSLAIDYWDYLGWKDTLALPGHGNRQRAYARARGDRNVFTPQAVVNGAAQAQGSDKSDIEQAISQTRKSTGTLSIPVTLAVNDDKLTVTAAAGKSGSERGEVWLCPVSNAISVEIARGENKGHTFTYHNVVRRWIRLGEWHGEATTWTVPLKDFKTSSIDKVAVIVQSGAASAPGAMYGAAMTALP